MPDPVTPPTPSNPDPLADLQARLTVLEAERDAARAAAAEAQASLAASRNRDKFRAAATARGVRPEALDDALTLSGLGALTADADDAALAAAIEAVAARPYLLAPPEPPAPAPPKPAPPPSPGRGVPAPTPGSRLPTEAQMTDPRWMAANQHRLKEMLAAS